MDAGTASTSSRAATAARTKGFTGRMLREDSGVSVDSPSMLVTLRLFLSSGEERLLSQEVEDGDEAPEQLLRRISRDGQVRLGDRESVPLDAIERVEVVPPPEPQVAPGFGPEGRLRDEDVDAAVKGNEPD
jgi:hypothetical protein